jgi:hypothetical protein
LKAGDTHLIWLQAGDEDVHLWIVEPTAQQSLGIENCIVIAALALYITSIQRTLEDALERHAVVARFLQP